MAAHLYAIPALMKKRTVTVKISDLAITDDPGVTLITYALGSCIGLTLWDPKTRIGGLLHYLMPCSSGISMMRNRNPLSCCDTAVPLFLAKMRDAGAGIRRLEAKAIGGAQVLGTTSSGADIGRYNYIALREQLQRFRIPLKAELVGGNVGRTAMLEVDCGKVTVRGGGKLLEI